MKTRMHPGNAGVVLCALNWLIFLAFIATREPRITNEYERDLDRAGSTFIFRTSAEPLTHIAARPLYGWTSWHGGERWWVKVAEIMNAPALALAHLSARSTTNTLFRSSSYYLESWVRAWLFAALATCQWIVVGRMITAVARRDSRRLKPR